MATAEISPAAIRYIKLGRGGAWAEQGLRDGTIPFGYHDADHRDCQTGNWEAVRAVLMNKNGRTAPGASQGVREIRDFYTLPDDTLWVTVAAGHLWWAFADGPVVPVEEPAPDSPSRFRHTRDGWSNKSLTGEALTVRSLSSALTRTANYRMTICEVERADYLLRRLRGEPDPLHVRASVLKVQMRSLALAMMAQLHWEEVETLVDLIFARDGWRRVSVLGQDQRDVDLVLEHATTGQSAWVQVKSGARQADLDDYLHRFRQESTCDRFYFACSKPAGVLTLPAEPNLHLWAGDRFADAAIDAGLFEWMIDRTR